MDEYMNSTKIRRVKKTTNEQFELLKTEMAVHPAAARGYGVGAQRAVVDAEWKDIVEKLNAIGPPERTMTEWKKVWSDFRLRSIKRFSDELSPETKTSKLKRKKIIEALNNSETMYASFADCKEERPCASPQYLNEDSFDNKSYDNPLDETESESDMRLDNAEKPVLKNELKSLEEDNAIYDTNHLNCSSIPLDRIESDLSHDKFTYLDQTLSSIEQQMRNQNKIMHHLTKITSNLAVLMERHVSSLEKQNTIMERQLKATECHNALMKRQEASRRITPRKSEANDEEGL